jgi:hypothetical protein
MRWQAKFYMTILLHQGHTGRKCVEVRRLSFALRHNSSDLTILRWLIFIDGHGSGG